MQLKQALPPSLQNIRAVEVLERSLANKRLGHGILLHGESLQSLELIVQAIAGKLLNTTRNPLEHPDCFTLRPSGKARMIRIGSEAERTSGEWPQNTMRRLVIDIKKTANQGGAKIGIIYEADRMNPASANAFLKTLEEPPAGTTLFLLTTRPYDLLDTIRSRCLNFRVPALSDKIQHTDWTAWATDYRAWLGLLIQGANKKTIPHIIMGAYGLNARFQTILKEMIDKQWKEERSKLPENITSDETAAIEARMNRAYRKQLFGEIERLTAHYARELEQLNPGRLPVTALKRVTETLEHSANLLEINFNQAAALELFFLKSMRIWTIATR